MNPVESTRHPLRQDDETPFNELSKQLLDNPLGKAWLKHLVRVANRVKINSDSPDPNAAIYKVAQLALVKTIQNHLKGTDIDE